MKADELQEFLHAADRAAGCPAVGQSIAPRVRRRAARRRLVRRITVAAVVPVVAASWLALHRNSIEAPKAEPVAITMPSDSVEEAARIAQQTAEDILRMRDRQAETAMGHRGDPAVRLDRELDETAMIFLAIGDQRVGQPGAAAEAVMAYRRVRDGFAKTPAAAIAAERLRQLQL